MSDKEKAEEELTISRSDALDFTYYCVMAVLYLMLVFLVYRRVFITKPALREVKARLHETSERREVK